MGRIIQAKLNTEPIIENRDLRYAVKHQGDGVRVVGKWQCDQFRDRKLISGGYPETPNVLTTEGLAKLHNIMFWETQKAASKIWYIGCFKNVVTPGAGNTAATCLGAAGTYGALQDADTDPATNYPLYDTATTATAVITNAAAKAEFTIKATITVYGAFLSSIQAKTGVSGTLMAAKKFDASRAVILDDQLAITYQLTATSS